MRRLVAATGLVLVLAFGAGALPAEAATFNVTVTPDNPPNGCTVSDCTLREAILAANSSAGADTVNVPAETYALAQGELAISDSVTINGAGARSLTVSGAGLSRVFHVTTTSATVTIAGMTISAGNDQPDGPISFTGAALENAGILTLSRVTVRDNHSHPSELGGTIIGNQGTLNVDHSTLRDNDTSGCCGPDGQTILGGVIHVDNSTFSGNVGSAINQSSGTVSNSTIALNAAYGIAGSPSPTVSNTILASNGLANCDGPKPSSGPNIEFPASGCGFANHGDPKLAPLANNGGPTDTHEISTGSAAIDTGPATCGPDDQRGTMRPQGPACDIGSFERAAATVSSADLSIDKSDGPACGGCPNQDPWTVGSLLTYTIKVTNGGPSAASSVSVTDTLPSGVTFQSASASQGSCSGGATVTCNLGTVTSSATVKIVVKPNQAGALSNTASVSSSTSDPNTANNKDTETTTVRDARAGETASGAGSANTDTEQDGATPQDPVETKVGNAGGPVTVGEGPVTTPAPSQYTIFGQQVSIGAPVRTADNPIQIIFLLDGSILPPNPATGPGRVQVLRNGAAVADCDPRVLAPNPSTAAMPDPCVSSRSFLGDDLQVVVRTSRASEWNFAVQKQTQPPPPPPKADLAVTLTDTPDPVTEGDPLTYKAKVANGGPNTAANVKLTDQLPPGASFVSASTTQGSCSGAPKLTCNLGSIGSGGSATVTIVVRPNSAGTIQNTAGATTDTQDPNAGNNRATATTTVKRRVPTSKKQCKNGGWQRFGFPNQGQCVSFVNHQRH